MARTLGAERKKAEEPLHIDLPGRLFFPEGERELACRIVSLSRDGAVLECAVSVAEGSSLVLYADGLGRFEAQALAGGPGVGIKFICTPAKRARIAEQVAALKEEGLEAAKLRRHEISNRNGKIHFTRANGQVVPCEIIDISVTGITLKTGARPVIGECVLIAQTAGRVARYHDYGIGIEFLGRAVLGSAAPT